MVQCRECEYWSPDGPHAWPRECRSDMEEQADNVKLHCRRHPPTVVVLTDEEGLQDTFTVWPQTSRRQGCGEGARFYSVSVSR